ncbi:MAG: AtpZ/AtpI family protein [Rhodobacteraceae bacterium]|nr:AtpZ/AtpI family protein [Paracoccaceae bacterium]
MKTPDDDSASRIGRRAQRMKEARERSGPSPLRGFGTFGMIGWSVAVPTVGGALLGLWLDRVAPQAFSWTLALLLGGVVLGGLIAWGWIEKEGGGDD